MTLLPHAVNCGGSLGFELVNSANKLLLVRRFNYIRIDMLCIFIQMNHHNKIFYFLKFSTSNSPAKFI